MENNLNQQLNYWLTDLQLSNDPKQYLLGRAYARLLELESLLFQWETEYRKGADNGIQS